MRRQLAVGLPRLMQMYPGLKPWDLDRMTFREIQLLLNHAGIGEANHGVEGHPDPEDPGRREAP